MTDTAANVDHDEIAKFEKLAARWWDPESEFKPLHDINPLRLDYIDRLASLAGKRVLAMAGIGNPGRFFALLRASGLEVEERPFPDHHEFRPADLPAPADPRPLLMTEKDAVKLARLARDNYWYLPVKAELDPVF